MKVEWRRKIKHITQPDNKTCTSACISMCTNIPIEIVISEFHDRYFEGELTASAYIRNKGLIAIDHLSNEHTILRGFIYLLGVPSLSSSRMMHSVLLDTTHIHDVELFDPMKGRGDYYASWDDVRGYVIDSQFVINIEVEHKKKRLSYD